MPPELAIASFNIHWGRGLRWLGCKPFDPVAACARLDADVLVLQESFSPDGGPAQHDAIAEALGYEVVAEPLARTVVEPAPRVVGRAGAPGGVGDWCLAVLSRLPTVATNVTPLPQLRFDPCSRAVVRVDVPVGDRTLAVHGTHLAHLEMGALLPSQRRALREVLAPAPDPALLIGDMNMWSWCVRALAPAGWRRVGRGRTFPTPYPHSRIDHLVVSPSVEVRSIEVVDERGSDHRPIRARLAVRTS